MVIALWVEPAEDDRLFATVGYRLVTSQSHFAVMETSYVTMDGAGSWRPTGEE